MDERLSVFLYAVGGLVVYAPVGAAFGAVAGAAVRASGRAAGSFVGLEVVKAMEEARGHSFSPIAAGAFVGAVDGACFLGVAGMLLGGGLTFLGKGHAHHFFNVGAACGLLALMAMFLGGLAYGLIHAGWRSVGLVFAVAAFGGLAGLLWGLKDGLFLGATTGAAVGAVVASVAGMLRKP